MDEGESQGGPQSVDGRVWQAATVVLLCAYFIARVLGCFPWKADEPYYFGVTWEMLRPGD